MDKKILAYVLIWWLTVTSFVTVSASFSNTTKWMWNMTNTELTDEQKTQMEAHRAIMEKVRNGETLTTEEQATLDEMKALKWSGSCCMGNDMWMWHKWWMWKNMLTDEEKEKIANMTDAEKKEYFEAKRTEQRTKMESYDNVMDKVLNWETLTSEEEVVKKELIEFRKNMKNMRNMKISTISEE